MSQGASNVIDSLRTVLDVSRSSARASPVSPKRVAVVGVSADEFATLAPSLEATGAQVDRFPRGRGALEVMDSVALDVVIVRFPLLDLQMSTFLAAIRSPTSLCRDAITLVLTATDDTAIAQQMLSCKADHILRLDATEEEVRSAVTRLTDIAPRTELHFPIRLEITVPGGYDVALGRMANISSTGMLVETERVYPPGTEAQFAFTLNGQTISGTVVIVRESDPKREGVRGLGCELVSVDDDGATHLRRYLDNG